MLFLMCLTWANSSRGQKAYHIIGWREASGMFASGVYSKIFFETLPKSSQKAEGAPLNAQRQLASPRSKRVPATKMESALMGRSHFSISR
jgi:hypothetical protein